MATEHMTPDDKRWIRTHLKCEDMGGEFFIIVATK